MFGSHLASICRTNPLRNRWSCLTNWLWGGDPHFEPYLFHHALVGGVESYSPYEEGPGPGVSSIHHPARVHRGIWSRIRRSPWLERARQVSRSAQDSEASGSGGGAIGAIGWMRKRHQEEPTGASLVMLAEKIVKILLIQCTCVLFRTAQMMNKLYVSILVAVGSSDLKGGS